ncbi:MAG: PPK2 family polyphosphate kinase [Chloroflexota bacterium]
MAWFQKTIVNIIDKGLWRLRMFKAVENPYLVPFDDSFKIDSASTSPPTDAPDKKKCKKLLESYVDELSDLQKVLYAHNRYGVLAIFQAMDAAGKDGTIRAVLTGVNPAGFQVFSFKQPSKEELDHDFLWRSSLRLPERGRIGIFNRSYYEETLVVKVHEGFLKSQNLPNASESGDFWKGRYQSIFDHEKHLAKNGYLILKFWLNVSKDEQKDRFFARLDDPEKHWKFSAGDVRERTYWDDYMDAYQGVLNATSRSWAPWYAIPADDKPFMRMQVAKIIVESLKSLNLSYPTVGPGEVSKFGEMRDILNNE